jgi:fructose-bisphosphate aldolase, class I
MTTAMQSTVAAMLARGKGILAADETVPTTESRFSAFGIAATGENRRAYRQLLFGTPGLNNFISAAIMVDETIRQQSAAGVAIPEALAKAGIMPGVSVDKGTVPLPGFPDEEMTEGLDGLRVRLDEYRKLGVSFTKWRTVITIGDGRPSSTCIETNVRGLALFAALSQGAGLVPIVEPEILIKGDHTIARCEEVTEATLHRLFIVLAEHGVQLDQMLLKTGMILPGSECAQRADLAVVAEATLRCLRRTVPTAVPGIVFLSGGQSAIEATERLNAVCQIGGAPWQLSFSFSRALQMPALITWRGLTSNIPGAQAALCHRALCNSAATRGEYSPEMESFN